MATLTAVGLIDGGNDCAHVTQHVGSLVQNKRSRTGLFLNQFSAESMQYSSVPDGTKYLAETQALGLGQILSCS